MKANLSNIVNTATRDLFDNAYSEEEAFQVCIGILNFYIVGHGVQDALWDVYRNYYKQPAAPDIGTLEGLAKPATQEGLGAWAQSFEPEPKPASKAPEPDQATLELAARVGVLTLAATRALALLEDGDAGPADAARVTRLLELALDFNRAA